MSVTSSGRSSIKARSDRLLDGFEMACAISAACRYQSAVAQQSSPLAAHWRDKINNAWRIVFLVWIEWQLQREFIFWVERCQIVEINPVTNRIWFFEVNRFNFQQSKIALAIFWRTNFTLNRIACAQSKATHLTWRYVNIVRSWQIIGSGPEANPSDSTSRTPLHKWPHRCGQAV